MLTKALNNIEDAQDRYFYLEDSSLLKCHVELPELVLVLFNLAVSIREGIFNDPLSLDEKQLDLAS